MKSARHQGRGIGRQIAAILARALPFSWPAQCVLKVKSFTFVTVHPCSSESHLSKAGQIGLA